MKEWRPRSNGSLKANRDIGNISRPKLGSDKGAAVPPVPPRSSFPGVYIEEQPSGVHSIPGVPTSITAFVGRSRRGPVESPVAVSSFADFERQFGRLWNESALGFAVRDFFLNGGSEALIVRLRRSDGGPLRKSDFIGATKAKASKGLYALNKADLFNLLCLPGYKDTGPGFEVDKEVISVAAKYCEARRAVLLVDPPASWRTKEDAKAGVALGVGTTSKNAALFFPRLRQPNPERNNQKEDFGPGGAVAGVFTRTDCQRGVWKAPAGVEATLIGVPELAVRLTDAETDELHPLAVNCLRDFPGTGKVVWGARTLAGSDPAASEWKYIPVRRTALFIEESLYRGTKWVVFEPNDESLWSQIRLNVGAFMQTLFRSGAFQGRSAREAYFVKCDQETNTQDDINRGAVNIIVGFAPLKPAEFVVIKIQQMAGQIETVLRGIASHHRQRGKKGAVRGTSALFVGKSGTGKTIAAEVLGRDLRLDLYRIDLGSVVSKFIGETEKNLDRIFDGAAKRRAILFFDEADALFDKRTEVNDSHDRFANPELDYLLQRMEQYRGLAILATSHKSAVDPAFLRRFRFVVAFPLPTATRARNS
jgi:phage tail sheath protein FI